MYHYYHYYYYYHYHFDLFCSHLVGSALFFCYFHKFILYSLQASQLYTAMFLRGVLLRSFIY